MLQDYEFRDPLKFVTNIKPNIISLDLESSVAPPVIKTNELSIEIILKIYYLY
jgi:hypothetical protein